MTPNPRRALSGQPSVPRIDAHQHFWKYNPIRDQWITEEMAVIRRDFLPDQLAPILKESKIDGCVSVQADQSEGETEFLVGLSAQYPFIKGVVGWVDISSEKINERLDYFSSLKIVKGFRHVVQAEPAGFLLQKRFLNGVAQLEHYNFTYDVLIYHHQLGEALEFVERLPNQKFVIDHIAKPDIANHNFRNWSEGISKLAPFENVSCKLSGMVTEAIWRNWKPSDFEPYLELALEKFGPKRLIYGSDWPVCLVAASYPKQRLIIEDYLGRLSSDENDLVMGGNAARFYNL